DQSDFPANAPKTSLSAYEPSAEAIAGYKPDLVVLADDTKNVKEALDKLSVPVLVQPAATTLDDAYREINELGVKTGHTNEASALVGQMQQQIAGLTKDLPKRSTPLTYYHELDNTLYTSTSHTFIGQLYALAGLTNVADAAGGGAGDYPQLSAEYLVQANPDLVFLADTKCCQQDATTFAARPGFADLKAVKQNHVILLDDDIASRWGPRVVDLLRQIVDATKSVPVT